MAQETYGSVREYIGARYVPVFANPAQWDNGREYEPLTIVLNEGNSYTSTQYVPTGVDITDERYWALTGNYNAQIEAYRKEVQGFDNRITNNENNIESNMNNITELTKQLNTTNTTLANVKQNADNSKEITDKIIIGNTIKNHILFQMSTKDTEQVSLVYYPEEGNRDKRNNLTAIKSGLEFFVNGTLIWFFKSSLAKITAAASSIASCGFRSALSGSGTYGVGLESTHIDDNGISSTASVEMTDRSYIFRQDGTIKASMNPVTNVSYPMENLQVALKNNIAVISCNGIDINFDTPTEWKTIATASQLGVTGSAGESVYGSVNIDYEGGKAGTLRFNASGLAIRASGVTAGTHNVYGQVVATVNVTFPLPNKAQVIDVDGEIEIPDIIPENEDLMTFIINE